jgi:uncharacterized flavoprotein (TIGR03862 family)
MKRAVVIGAGPAGLMAADELASAGLSVLLAEAKPSPARKFLMAGKSGLNLTKDEPLDRFLAAYGDARAHLTPMITDFGPEGATAWATGLGQEMFAGSSGRVFPKVMKASPLLRAWMGRLDGMGVELRRNHRWTGWNDMAAVFDTPDGPTQITADVTVLALGGASWARLGSDGAWASTLAGAGVDLTPFQPANMGFGVDWSDKMARHFGQPVKGVRLSAGNETGTGEFVISARGLEGGGIYALSRAMRDGAPLYIDLMPDWDEVRIKTALNRPRGKNSLTNHLRKVLRLPPEKIALLMEWGGGARETETLARAIKSLPARHTGPHPMDEAISTAGGVAWGAVDADLMLNARAGVFCAGEMLDWEAPTGGYLLTACLATGRWAGRAAARYACSRDTAR